MRNGRASSEEARERLRAAADQIEIGPLFRGVGLKVAFGAVATGVVLGASPAARKAIMNGLRVGYQQMQMMRASQRRSYWRQQRLGPPARE